MTLLIHLVHCGDMKADRNGVRLDHQSVFYFPGDVVHVGRQNSIVKASYVESIILWPLHRAIKVLP